MKPKVVLLHGWGYTPAIWRGLSAELPDFSVSAPDTLSIHACIDTWADAFSATIPDHSLLVGWSLGAMLALVVASRHARKVSGLLLIGVTPRMTRTDNWPHGMEAAALKNFLQTFEENPKRVERRFLALQLLGDRNHKDVSHVLESALCDIAACQQELRNGLDILARTDLLSIPMPVNIPVHILHGENDALMPVGAARWLHNIIPESHLHLVKDAGHAPLFSQPGALAELVRETCHV
jgi:pimeloyl-[acyl-carrier protein] methyl ester esterase